MATAYDKWLRPVDNYELKPFECGKACQNHQYYYTYLAIGSLVSNQFFPNVAFTLKDSCIIDVDVSYLNLKQSICELYTNAKQLHLKVHQFSFVIFLRASVCAYIINYFNLQNSHSESLFYKRTTKICVCC